MTKIEKINYKGTDCLRLERNGVEAVVTTDVGPRVVRFGFVGGANHFLEREEQLEKHGTTEYTCYGGHRVWHAPEDKVRTYEADNYTVAVERRGETVLFTSPVDPVNQVSKCMEITMTDTGLQIVNRVSNHSPWEIELAAWAITVMDVNGLEAVPQNRTDTGLLGNRSLALWPYTKIADPRIFWGDRYVTLTGEKNTPPVKLGFQNECGFAGYFNHGELFVKTYDLEDDAVYPDFNCNYETYSCGEFTELESLSPMTVLAPGECAETAEEWFLFRDIARPLANDEDAIERVIQELNFI